MCEDCLISIITDEVPFPTPGDSINRVLFDKQGTFCKQIDSTMTTVEGNCTQTSYLSILLTLAPTGFYNLTEKNSIQETVFKCSSATRF